MDERELLEAQFTAMGDQLTAYVRDNYQEIHHAIEKDPRDWTQDEADMVIGCAYGLLGFVYAGKV